MPRAKKDLFSEMREAMGEKPKEPERQAGGTDSADERETTGTFPADTRQPMERRNLRLPPEHWRALERIAADERRPISEVVREAIREYLRRR